MPLMLSDDRPKGVRGSRERRPVSPFDVSVMLSLLRNSSERLARTGVVCGVALLVFIAYALPLLGFLASMCIPFLTHKARRHLWPETLRDQSIAWSVVAWVGLWLSGLISTIAPVLAGPGEGGGFEASTLWLVMPLCAPDSLNAVLLPALAAAVTCLAGLLGAVATRRAWPWVAAAWLAPWVHYLVFAQIPHESSASRTPPASLPPMP